MNINVTYEGHTPDIRKESRMLTLEVGEAGGRIAIGLKLTNEAHSHRMCLIDVDEAERLAIGLAQAIARAAGKADA
jgi:hypothetical protein